MTGFSFSGLSIEDADVPKGQRRGLTDNPMVAQIKLSASKRTNKEDGTWIGAGRAFTLQNAADAIPAVNAIRNAADRENVGARVALTGAKGETLTIQSLGSKKNGDERAKGGTLHVMHGEKKYTGTVKVTFAAKSKNARKPKPAAKA